MTQLLAGPTVNLTGFPSPCRLSGGFDVWVLLAGVLGTRADTMHSTGAIFALERTSLERASSLVIEGLSWTLSAQL